MSTKLGRPCFLLPVTAPEVAEFHERRAALLHDLVVHRRLDQREVLREDRPWRSLPNAALGFPSALHSRAIYRHVARHGNHHGHVSASTVLARATCWRTDLKIGLAYGSCTKF
jgi:hypothetical protein